MPKRVALTQQQADPRGVAEAVQTFDGWMNMLELVGAIGTDKRSSNVAIPIRYSQQQAEAFWESSDTAERIVETRPNEMIREGWEIAIEEDTTASEELDALMEDLEVPGRFLEALNYRSAYGGGAILIGADDGQKDWAKPLAEERIREIHYLSVLTPEELKPVLWYDRATDPKFGEPAVWKVRQPRVRKTNVSTTEEVLIHESRLVRFVGSYVSRRQLRMNSGWGNSVFCRVAETIRDFERAYQGTSLLLEDFSQAVFKLKGLTKLLAQGKTGDEAVAKRISLMQLSRNMARALIMDAENEEFERKATPMSGLPESLQQLALRLSAAARIPVTILMGQSPAGLNATGASDIRWWYDTIRSDQRRIVAPKLNRLVTLMMLSKEGPTKGTLPDNWALEFKPLWQLSEIEQADRNLKQAQADKLMVDSQVATPEEIAISRFSRTGYSLNTTIDVDAREKFLDENPPMDKPEEPPLPAGGEPPPGGNPLPAGGTKPPSKGGAQTTPGSGR